MPENAPARFPLICRKRNLNADASTDTIEFNCSKSRRATNGVIFAFGYPRMIERRTAQRHRVLKQGTLAFSSGGSADCTVRNISSNGARIEIENPVGLPESFTLVIASAHIMRHCHPVWIGKQQMGIAFD